MKKRPCMCIALTWLCKKPITVSWVNKTNYLAGHYRIGYQMFLSTLRAFKEKKKK